MELAIVGGLAVTSIYYRFTINYRRKRKVIKKWNELMDELKLYSKKSNFIPQVTDVKFIDNGYILSIHIPTGLNVKDVESNKEAIENKFKGIVTIESIRFSSLAKIKVINKDIGKFIFKPVKAYPNQLYIGKTFDGEDYFIDITKACHILIGGATGTGKSFLLSSILTNLIYNSSNSIEIHLLQIMKGEVGLFEKCKPVKFVGKNLKEVAYDLDKLARLVDERSRKFTELGVKNLNHYNKHYKSKMKRIYCVTEELSFFMPQESDSEEDKELKNKCWSAILTIAKAGRSSGIHLLSLTQRSTTTNLPSDVKSQLCRITFRQISSIDSRNIIECDDATQLEDRECLCYGTSKTMEVIKTPWIDEDFKILHEYVPEIIIPGIKVETNLLNKKPIVVNNGIPRELPLYIPKKEPNNIKENEVATTKVIKKKIRKGMIED
ncbi:MAG: FtsK/SpoIIIE domain-containing protein [Clostridium sp.]|uniref:FtsK/SpoIIIE domain-containing protein n=1 Tax=Clostridium sp. TaxID=1506 RepID=UPI00290AB7DA|nr:FtsK/SpoIIIE domain-containing protein [Clostridium sp.]MDU7150161.1 FtsK/SpoIIIE domain-containing protein [Clostridium sp.]MDU7243336.1 FtsK/SpoIIIE domain-containing protein [Clostridium sp.]